MNCAEAQQFFDAYLDDELAGALRLEFDTHRLQCPHCQRQLAMMETCAHLLAEALAHNHDSLDLDFTDRVMSEIATRQASRALRRKRWLMGAGIAAQAAVIVAGVMLWPALMNDAEPAADPSNASANGHVAGITERSLIPPPEVASDKLALRDFIFTGAEKVRAASSALAEDVQVLEFARQWQVPAGAMEDAARNPIGALIVPGGAVRPDAAASDRSDEYSF